MALEKALFKNALAHWASGVTVVTTQWAGENSGLTVSSFTGVSLEPPLISVCLARSLYTHDLLRQSGTFAVSILEASQIELGMRFAGMLPDVVDRFEGLQWEVAVTGCPILPGCLAWLDCRIHHSFEAGDHSIFVGEVVKAFAHDDGAPLLFYDRNWSKLG